MQRNKRILLPVIVGTRRPSFSSLVGIDWLTRLLLQICHIARGADHVGLSSGHTTNLVKPRVTCAAEEQPSLNRDMRRSQADGTSKPSGRRED